MRQRFFVLRRVVAAMQTRMHSQQLACPSCNEGREGPVKGRGDGTEPAFTRGLGPDTGMKACKRDMRWAFKPSDLHGTGPKEENEDSSFGTESVWMGGMPLHKGRARQTLRLMPAAMTASRNNIGRRQYAK